MSDFDLIIRGGSVVRPDGVAKLDLGIKDGLITALGNAVFGSTDSDLDASDFYIFPGGVDPHVHFNEPGRTDWEGFEHGSRALAAGGVTSFFDMPLNAQPPVLDKGGFLAKWNFAKSSSLLDFGLWGGLCDESLAHMQDLTECGVIGFKAFMCNSGVDDFPMADDGTLLEGMRRAFDLEQIIAVHAENEGITARLARRAVADGRLAPADYLASRPAIAELEAIQRAIFFAWETECSLHIAHVSTARGHRTHRQRQGPGAQRVLRDLPALPHPDRRGCRTPRAAGQVRPAAAHPRRANRALGIPGRRGCGHDRFRPLARAARREIQEEPVRLVGRHRRVPVDPAAHAHRRRGPSPSAAARTPVRTARHQRGAPFPPAPGKRARSARARTPIWLSSTST